jgi:pyruvate,orthophosphate dikinase
LIQCRNGKRTGSAAIKIAVDLFKEGIITKDEAITKVPAHTHGASQCGNLMRAASG